MEKQIFRVLLYSALISIAVVRPSSGQAAQFFRIFGPVATTITKLTPGGSATWTNTATNTTFTVQVADVLRSQTNWVDWVQVPVSNTVTVHRLFDPNPPANMAFIPAGSFTMGDAFGEGDSDELPTHRVYVSAFYMDKFEVTKTLWEEVRQWATNQNFKFYENTVMARGKATNHPIQTVSWYDCVKWCNGRSQMEGLTPCYYTDTGLTMVYKSGFVSPYVNWSANGYRLPTEAEWEKAARGGGSERRFSWSDVNSIQHTRANFISISIYAYDTSSTRGYHPTFYVGNAPYTSSVGYFAPNGYGLCDMVGNVLEWCWDWHSGIYYNNSPPSNPSGFPGGTLKVLRGGNYGTDAKACRAASRLLYAPNYAADYIGFRSVRSSFQ